MLGTTKHVPLQKEKQYNLFICNLINFNIEYFSRLLYFKHVYWKNLHTNGRITSLNPSSLGHLTR